MTPSYAIIPTRGSRPDLLFGLAADLTNQNCTTLILDTGLRRSHALELDLIANLYRYDLHGADFNIHAWWNHGLDKAKRWARMHGQRTWNVHILNDDIRIADNYIAEMDTVLRLKLHDEVGVAGPGQVPHHTENRIVEVNQIAAGVDEPNTGLPGWAMSMRGEDLWRFDERYRWWWGDNDMLRTVALKTKRRVVLNLRTWVEHVDGGTQSGMPDHLVDIIEQDREAFRDKWADTLHLGDPT